MTKTLNDLLTARAEREHEVERLRSLREIGIFMDSITESLEKGTWQPISPRKNRPAGVRILPLPPLSNQAAHLDAFAEHLNALANDLNATYELVWRKGKGAVVAVDFYVRPAGEEEA